MRAGGRAVRECAGLREGGGRPRLGSPGRIGHRGAGRDKSGRGRRNSSVGRGGRESGGAISRGGRESGGAISRGGRGGCGRGRGLVLSRPALPRKLERFNFKDICEQLHHRATRERFATHVLAHLALAELGRASARPGGSDIAGLEGIKADVAGATAPSAVAGARAGASSAVAGAADAGVAASSAVAGARAAGPADLARAAGADAGSAAQLSPVSSKGSISRISASSCTTARRGSVFPLTYWLTWLFPSFDPRSAAMRESGRPA